MFSRSIFILLLERVGLSFLLYYHQPLSLVSDLRPAPCFVLVALQSQAPFLGCAVAAIQHTCAVLRWPGKDQRSTSSSDF